MKLLRLRPAPPEERAPQKYFTQQDNQERRMKYRARAQQIVV